MSYSSLAEVYDRLTENVEYEKRAEYIHSLLLKNSGDSGVLLDLACGTGTLSLELSKFGYDVILCDLSAASDQSFLLIYKIDFTADAP